MSQLKVNSIVPSGGLTSGANGGIVQTVVSHMKARQSISGSLTFQPTGLSATITPSSNNSKILIVVNGIYNVYNATHTQFFCYFKLYNGTSEITDANSTGSTNNMWKTVFEVDSSSGNHQQYEQLPLNGEYLYTHGGSAGTAITINLYASCHNGASPPTTPTTNQMYFNGRHQTNYGTTSTMILYEIGG